MSLEIELQEKSTSVRGIFKNELGTFTNVSWEPAPDLPLETWIDRIRGFDAARRSINFYIGDGLNWGEMVYGESYAQIADMLDMPISTLYNMKWVCSKVPPSLRRENLEWEHHKVVAGCRTLEEMDHWLGQAEIAGYTSRELIRAMRGEEVALIGSIEATYRGKRKLLTEFFSLAVSNQETIDKWLESLDREEINRLLDGELDESLIRLKAILDILRLY